MATGTLRQYQAAPYSGRRVESSSRGAPQATLSAVTAQAASAGKKTTTNVPSSAVITRIGV